MILTYYNDREFLNILKYSKQTGTSRHVEFYGCTNVKINENYADEKNSW